MKTMEHAVEEARRRIIFFTIANGISLNRKITGIPVKTIEEFFIGRDQSGENLTMDEVLDDLNDSEAMIYLDDTKCCRPVVIINQEKMSLLDFEDQVQILIHEFLHYKDLYSSDFTSEDEVEDEIVSILIALYFTCQLEEGLALLYTRINPTKMEEAYGVPFAKAMQKKLSKIGRKEIVERIS